VTIEVVFRDPTSLSRKLAGTFALLFMFVFAGTAAFYGFDLWLKSTLAGHTTDTYLAPPKMLTHAPVWLGCVLLILQGIAEIIRIWTVGIPDDDILDRQH
jgi:C4-dicarboxylate transporter DctQ subunit